jgi:glutamate-1-semialdehyde 2,1-aminomutase
LAVDPSKRLFERALRVMPGGVSSPVRAFGAVGGQPVFVARGAGARIWGADGKELVDWVGSWGPLILGHAHPRVVAAAIEATRRGTTFGASTESEVRLAEAVCALHPSVERIRFVSSGTEAVMSALRVARAATARPLVIKMEGCYHGHTDSLLVRAGSGGLTLGVPDSAGVPPEIAALTINVPYNDLGAIDAALAAHPNAVAAVVVEPVAGNMGVVAPKDGYLAGLRRATEAAGALLVFDEVITGFRVSLGGAQEKYGVRPDLTCFGKILGGGFPLAAYGGRADLMKLVAPEGPVYQAGTLSGNPVAVAAGLATLQVLGEGGLYERLETQGARLEEGLRAAADEARVPATVNRVGSLTTLFFTEGPVVDLASALRSDRDRFAAFHAAMLRRGIYLPPSQFEAWFLSLAHSDEDLRLTLAAARESMLQLV